MAHLFLLYLLVYNLLINTLHLNVVCASMDSDVTTDGEGMDTDKDELLENDFLAMKSQR